MSPGFALKVFTLPPLDKGREFYFSGAFTSNLRVRAFAPAGGRIGAENEPPVACSVLAAPWRRLPAPCMSPRAACTIVPAQWPIAPWMLLLVGHKALIQQVFMVE
jgi:hypothetical protein